MLNPLIPMGAITGKPDLELITYTLKMFKKAGIEQYLIYPRSGCELEYLEDEWFDCCRNIVETAEKLGYKAIWLYDEFNWPSGQCGGKTMQHSKDFQLKTLHAKRNQDGTKSFEIVYNPKFPDLLNPEAVAFFIENTYDKYFQRLGKHFGTLIKGIFSDEPSPGYCGEYTDQSTKDTLKITWWNGLEDDYLAMTGRNLRDDLDHPDFQKNHSLLIGKQFRKVYFDPLRTWCDEHNILLTGHLMGEHTVSGSKRFNGDPLLAIAGFSLPGLDEISTRTTLDTIEWLTFATARYGIEANQNGGLAELFALGPADLPPARLRQMIALCALHGIDRYVMAVSQVDFRGNVGKPIWFNPCSDDQPWFTDNLEFLAHDARQFAKLTKLKRIPELAVRYPLDLVDINPLLKLLVSAQIQWHLINHDEQATDEIEVINPTKDGFHLENANLTFKDPNDLVEYVDEYLPKQALVTNEDGTKANNIFLKSYSDGTIAVLDLHDEVLQRNLILNANGVKRHFTLYGRDIHIAYPWTIMRDRPNIARPTFETNETTLEVKNKLTVQFALRTYHDPASVSIDGQPIEIAKQEATLLPHGFQELYATSKPITLQPGTHTLKLEQGEDFKLVFMPPAWIIGDFAFTSPNVLDIDRHDGEGLDNFAGTITQSSTISIPLNATAIQLETDELFTEITLDTTSLGTRGWSPFIWNIPAPFRGKTVKIQIRRQTSIAPIFGKRELLDAILKRKAMFCVLPGKYPIQNPLVEPKFILF